MNTEITDERDARIGWVCYDAECALCVRWAGRFRRMLARRGFATVPLQDLEVRRRLNLAEADLLREMRVIRTDGIVLGGADAILHLAGSVRWGWPIWLLGQLPGVRPLLRWSYRQIADRRRCADGRCAAEQRKEKGTMLDWLPLALLPGATAVLGANWPAWVYMWALAFALFGGCKWLTFRRAWRAGANAHWTRSAGYLFFWPGMDADRFLNAREGVERPLAREWLGAALNVIVGIALAWGVARTAFPAQPILAGWIGMVGLIFVLHFGLFRLWSVAWRAAGVDAQPLMRAPIAARSLAEFWGARWNTGFHQLAYEFLFRPLHRRVGAVVATLIVFFVSGLVHELVISVPARGGYGLPTAYFLIQGAGMLLERFRFAGRRPGRGWPGWLFTVLVTAGPVFWLFHPPFVKNVMIPFLTAIHAI